MSGLVTYFRNVRAEMKHVVWPNPRSAAWHAALIVVISGILGGCIALLDYGFTNAVASVIGRF
jgi:preprotein translocase SecE subunit